MPVTASIYFHLFEGSEEGKRPPVVLIHGAGGTHLSWPPQLRRLTGYRVYAPDLPGHGKSNGVGLQSIPAYTQKMVEWLGACGLHSAVFVGHSMGGAIALSLALDYPQHVQALGLIGADSNLHVNPVLLDAASSPNTYLGAVEKSVAWSFSSKTSERLVELACKRMAETRQSVLYGDFLACDAFNVTERLSRVSQPTLVLCGVEDRMTPMRGSQRLESLIPNATIKTIPDAGHMVMLERPEVVTEEMLAFLSEIVY
jgi:pimeloyl-ACP methyl ester carboxylesterase